MATLEPTTYTLPVTLQYKQKFLAIRDRLSRKLVTVIEFLSPLNKSPGIGLRAYRVKRWNVFNDMAHLVEIDLLRGGTRLATREPLALGDCYAFLSRWQRPSRVEVYCWGLKDRLPVIPVPLADDPDVPLDLQAAFVMTYDCASYDYGLDYRQAVKPPLEPAAAEWVRSVLSEKKLI